MSCMVLRLKQRNQKKKGKWLRERRLLRGQERWMHGCRGGVTVDNWGKVKDGKDGDGNIKK